MTTLTQAQIEAAAEAMHRYDVENGYASSLASVENYQPIARAALTAAAEVNEPSKMFAYISGQTTGKIAELEAREEYALGHLESQIRDNEKLRTELAAIIERCAQVADKQTQSHNWQVADAAEAIAAAIRALKDKP